MRLWDFSFSISQPFCGEHMLTVITNKQQSPRLRGVHQKLGWMVSSLLTSPTWSSCFPLLCQRAFSRTRESAQPVCACKSWPQGQSPTDRGWESVNVSTPYLEVGPFWHVNYNVCQSAQLPTAQSRICSSTHLVLAFYPSLSHLPQVLNCASWDRFPNIIAGSNVN